MQKPLKQWRDIINVPNQSICISPRVPVNITTFNDLSNGLDLYAKKVLEALIKNMLPLTPSNFLLYFRKLLKRKSELFKEQQQLIKEFKHACILIMIRLFQNLMKDKNQKPYNSPNLSYVMHNNEQSL